MKGFPGIKSTPTKSRNKAKLGIISEYEKRDNKVNINVEVCKKIINGKEVVSAKMTQYDFGPISVDGKRAPLIEEYTDMDKFTAALKDRVQKVGKALK